MAIRKIARLGHPVLRKVAQPIRVSDITAPKIRTLINDMIETMRDADGAGLAAPQVHESVRLCVLEVKQNPRYPTFPEVPLTILVNPVLTPVVVDPTGPASDSWIELYEGCLSVPGLRGRVRRPSSVSLSALDASGQPIERTVRGVEAAILQHEIDHLDGMLFVDRADTRTLAFQREYERYAEVPASAGTEAD